MDEYQELCKEVWERLGWQQDKLPYTFRFHKPHNSFHRFLAVEVERDNHDYANSKDPGVIRFREENIFFPAYDTDYVLNKLEAFRPHLLLTNAGEVSPEPTWCAFPSEDDGFYMQFDDEPIVALLKMVIKLNDNGLLEKEG